MQRVSVWKAERALLAVAVGLLLVPIYVGVSAFTMSTEAAGASACDAHYISGVTLNTTDVTAELVGKEIGVTNAWCSEPQSLSPGQSDEWKEGDNFFEPSLKLSYRMPGGVVVDLHAEIHFIVAGFITAGCSVNNPDYAGRTFTCSTSTSNDGEGRGFVYLVIS